MTGATNSSPGLGAISLVCIATAGQDAAVAFYVDRLGFEKRVDTAFGNGYRWIEVYPPQGTTGIALAPPPENREAPGGMQTGITLTCEDIDAAHATLLAAGVDVDPAVSRMGGPVPPLFWLRDPEGNVLMVAGSVET